MRYTRERKLLSAGGLAWALWTGMLVTFALCTSAQQPASVQIGLGTGYTAAGNTVEIPIDIASSGDKPTSLFLLIAYDPELAVPAESFYEANEVDDRYGLPVIDADGNTRTSSSAVLLDSDLSLLGKATDVTVFPEGAAGILISGAPDEPIRDGRLCTLAFQAQPGVTLSNVAFLRGIPSDAPMELDGDQVSSWGAQGVMATLAVVFTDGQIGFLACSTKPKSPKGIEVTEDFPDGVRVSWESVAGAGIEYRVFRSTTHSVDDAVALGKGWQASNVFVDITAAAAALNETAGCFLQPKSKIMPYFYWVKSRAAGGCESSFSRRSQAGERSAYSAAPRKGKISAAVLPGRSMGGPALLTELQSPLAIRIEAARAIDPLSVRGQVTSANVTSTSVDWVPALGLNATNNRSRSGWVVFRPSSPWVSGDTITMTVSAKTLTGREIAPITREFLRAPDIAGAGDTSGTVKLVALGLDVVPQLAPGLGTPYLVTPNEVYGRLQQIQLPLPPDRKAREVELYYFSEAEGDARWVLGRSVEGWLGANTPDEKTVGEIQYLIYWIRHGGVIQLGLNPGREAEQPAAADVSGGQAGSLAVSLMTLLVLAAGRGRTRRVPGMRD